MKARYCSGRRCGLRVTTQCLVQRQLAVKSGQPVVGQSDVCAAAFFLGVQPGFEGGGTGAVAGFIQALCGAGGLQALFKAGSLQGQLLA